MAEAACLESVVGSYWPYDYLGVAAADLNLCALAGDRLSFLFLLMLHELHPFHIFDVYENSV